MKFKLKKRHSIAIGMPIGLLVFAIGREIWRAFAARPAGQVISEAISAVGSLKWFDTTLVTGLVAIGAAYVSVRAIRDQIAADERSVQRQMEQTKSIERDKLLARHVAARAVMPLSLSAICNYAQSTLTVVRNLIPDTQDERIPKTDLGDLPELPRDAIDLLKEMIEVSVHEHRVVYAGLVAKIQIHSSRMRGMKRDLSLGDLTLKSLHTNALDAAELHAKASLLFGYGRFDEDSPTARNVDLEAIGSALHSMGVFSKLYYDLCERAKTYFWN
ncbi:hypothetical protein [Rhizobium laguerreae]|uniref:hypothetical protein n=1 Tax=Rhizobium laguerreae TaxID=1076926 RepID=UPI001C92B015|nr:hypothetical protein [Rhizobium laguerreae]MBY3199988.1 hypothetical protein [Rhizobium laguerreae]